MREMKEESAQAAAALGLPPEAKYSFLQAKAQPAPSAHAQTAAPTDEALRERLYQVVRAFLAEYMHSRLPAFEQLWDQLRRFPVTTVASNLSPTSAASTGLGFAAGSDTLLAIISTTAWVLTT